MKKIYLNGLILMVLCNASFGQIANYQHEFNNVGAKITNAGVLFQDVTAIDAGYEIPKHSGLFTLFNLSFWYAGLDGADQLKLSGTTYTPHSDLFPGPLSTTGGAEASPEGGSDLIYLASKTEIDFHKENWDLPGYEVPSNIENWPAHGDVDLEQDFYLAPFIDANHNSVYDPENGDYPDIRGDFASYAIMNDKLYFHSQTGGAPIGIEVHQMVYVYAYEDYLNNTVFIHNRLINRSTQTLFDFRSGVFMDPDIGDPTDDFMGVNVENNVAFGYNGDDLDEDYGAQPPAIGVVSLNREVDYFAPMDIFVGPRGMPSNQFDYYNYMNGHWPDENPFTYGGAGFGGDSIISYVYDGNPNNPEGWSELANGNAPHDVRGVMSHAIDVLLPQDELCFDYAVVYSREGSFVENVQGVIDLSAEVKAFYDDFGYDCEMNTIGIKKRDKSNFSIYPNPSNGQFTVEGKKGFDLEVLSMDGRIMFQTKSLKEVEYLELDLAKGTYVVRVLKDGEEYNSLLIIQ
ncbi:T9SS type A sorting domain-containing protein [Crocinitomix algicola]|uniref:T9SS type A sorting domain-containing protein n=1 Tax=Crocinitomix algicola TaxID=1740263 RepID=UPI000872ED95|nr:T9SS type A sorting domain-containing protein [Crocinitomix algicola]